MIKKTDGTKEDLIDFNSIFLNKFDEEIKKIEEKSDKKLNQEMIKEMEQQAKMLIPLVLPEMNKNFGNFDLVSSERELRCLINENTDYEFTGFIDTLIKTEDGKYIIIDWKTCSWGWDMEKRNSKQVTYQLTYYKHFLCKVTQIKPEDVETYFGLLKRTATKENVEIFRVTSGDKKISNALNVLDSCVINISRENFVKNKLSCSKCEFKKTVYCP